MCRVLLIFLSTISTLRCIWFNFNADDESCCSSLGPRIYLYKFFVNCIFATQTYDDDDTDDGVNERICWRRDGTGRELSEIKRHRMQRRGPRKDTTESLNVLLEIEKIAKIPTKSAIAPEWRSQTRMWTRGRTAFAHKRTRTYQPAATLLYSTNENSVATDNYSFPGSSCMGKLYVLCSFWSTDFQSQQSHTICWTSIQERILECTLLQCEYV